MIYIIHFLKCPLVKDSERVIKRVFLKKAAVRCNSGVSFANESLLWNKS